MLTTVISYSLLRGVTIQFLVVIESYWMKDRSIRSEREFTHGANNGLKIAIDFCGNLFLTYGEILLNYWLYFFFKLDIVLMEYLASQSYECITH